MLKLILSFGLVSINDLSADERMQKAIYLNDAVTNSCPDCWFIPVHFWFCFATGDQVLVGQTIAWRWQYDPTEMFKLRKRVVSVRHTDTGMWVVRTDGKELKLRRDNSYTDFVQGCQKIASETQIPSQR
jgi:hypothetical protein